MQEVQAKLGVPGAPAAGRASLAPPGPEEARDHPPLADEVSAAKASWLGSFELLLMAAYPFAVYFGLTRLGPGPTAGLLVAMALLRVFPWLVRRREERGRAALLHTAGLLALAARLLVTQDGRVALALPVVVNLGLLAFFAASLRSGVPVVETIARRIDGELSEARRVYCRTLTRVWCLFFASNAAIAGTLALAAPLAWWTAYTGVISYAVMGALFLAEYGVRRRRFPQTASERGEWTRVAEKGSVLGLQIIWFVCRVLGRRAVRLLIRFVALYYVLTDAEMRRVSQKFQQRAGLPGTFLDVYKHVLRFSFCIVDRLFLLSGRTEHFEFESHGDAEVRAILDRGQA